MSKAGKRFAFVRFIKVDNVERLVGNLCTLWIGRKHLQANVARFDRNSIPSKRVPHKFNHVAPTPTSFVSAVKGVSSGTLLELARTQSEYVAPHSIKNVRQWFPIIGCGEAVEAKGTLKKSLLLPRWSLANGDNIDYEKLIWEYIITKLNKKTREKVVPYT
ncbi:hypothetical protein Tco_1414905, partial [Tanacetum coccineum]